MNDCKQEGTQDHTQTHSPDICSWDAFRAILDCWKKCIFDPVSDAPTRLVKKTLVLPVDVYT